MFLSMALCHFLIHNFLKKCKGTGFWVYDFTVYSRTDVLQRFVLNAAPYLSVCNFIVPWTIDSDLLLKRSTATAFEMAFMQLNTPLFVIIVFV